MSCVVFSVTLYEWMDLLGGGVVRSKAESVWSTLILFRSPALPGEPDTLGDSDDLEDLGLFLISTGEETPAGWSSSDDLLSSGSVSSTGSGRVTSTVSMLLSADSGSVSLNSTATPLMGGSSPVSPF